MPNLGQCQARFLKSDCRQDRMWTKGVSETIRESKVYISAKVLEILESINQRIEDKNE